MFNVHLRVNDASTGEALPVRLRITGPNGEHYVPLGRLAEFATMRAEEVGGSVLLGDQRWYLLDGPCEIPLPSGVPLRVQASHGYQYEWLDETLTLKPGQMAIRLNLKKLVNWPGWFSSEGRCHHLTPHSAIVEALAEDVDLVQLLVHPRRFLSQDGNTFPSLTNLTAFSGQTPALQAFGKQVAVNTLNSHAMLGQLALLHAHRPIYPLNFGPPDDTDDWGLADWSQQCHRKGGFVVWVNPWKQEGCLPGGEALNLAILGKLDALEFDGQPRKVPFLPLWYKLLNCGFLLPIVGSSGKDCNKQFLGTPRTFVQAASPSMANWIEAVKSGNSFVSNGPLLMLERLDTKRVRAVAESVIPFEQLELVGQGRALARSQAVQHDQVWRAEIEHGVEGASQWLAARVLGNQISRFAPPQPIFAHTNPIWLEGDSPAKPPSPSDLAFLQQCVEQTQTWLQDVATFNNPVRKTQQLERCAEALAVLNQRGSA